MILDYLMIVLALFAIAQSGLRLSMLLFSKHRPVFAVIYLSIVIGAFTSLFYAKEGATVMMVGVCASLWVSRRSWLFEPPPVAEK